MRNPHGDCLTLLIALVVCLSGPGSGGAQIRARQRSDLLEQWVFRGRSQQQLRDDFRSELKLQIQFIDRVCGLTDNQKDKIEAAGNADINRLFRRCDVIRLQLEEMEMTDLNELAKDREQLQIASQMLQPLMMELRQGVFDKNSLMQRLLKSVLEKEQRAAFKAELDRARERRHRAVTRANIADLERRMPMTDDQRRRLLKLLEGVEIRLREDRAGQLNPSMVDASVGLLKLLKVDRDKLQTLLDEHQIEVIDETLASVRGWEQLLQ